MSGAAGEAGWFATLDPDPDQPALATPFIHRVRAQAPQRIGHLVRPSDTSRLERGGCVLLIEVPGFPDLPGSPIDNVIQVMWDGIELAGHWGSRHRWDDFDARDEEALVVRGLRLDDERAADAAMEWLATQLTRPVEQRLWTRRAEVVGRTWVLSDTGRVLGRRGGMLSRLGSPAEVVVVRPKAGGD